MIGSKNSKINLGVLFLASIALIGLSFISNTDKASAIMSVRDDNCYSTLSALSEATGGILGRFGMVNAIVKVPVYDWDQTPDFVNPITDSISGATSANSVRTKPVGHLQYFSASVTPIPNIQWIQEYATKQAPYDISKLGALVGMGGTVPEPSPFIANPLMYQRTSVINKDGTPNIGFTNPDYESAPSTGYDIGGVDFGIFESIDGINDSSTQYMSEIVSREELQDLRNNREDYRSESGATSLFNGTGAPFSVNANNPLDNCYEFIDSNKKVPAYAFSVVGIGIPITFPGTAISPLTLAIVGQPSYSGVTIYPGSLNGKMMLDCYGRGQTVTMTTMNRSIGQVGLGGEWYQTAIYAIALAADLVILGPVSVLFGGEVIQKLPMPKVVWENYFNGMAYLFNVDTPRSVDLPAHLQSREIDFSKSKLTSINTQVLMERNGGHGNSNNGSSYFPNLYVTLKKPFKHVPVVAPNPEDQEQDGTMIALNPKIQKLGFRESPSYDDTGSNNHKPVDGFAKARIVEIILEPGQYGREIRDHQFEGAELGTTNGLDPNQLCSFMRARIGDSTAECDASRPEFGGSTGIDLNSLPGATSENRTNAFNLIGSNGGILNRKIPAETKPGTKFCYAIYLNHRDNDVKYDDEDYYREAYNYNSRYSALRDKRFLSKTYCVVSGYKPSFQVRGGDLIVSGTIETETNRKEYLANDATYRTYGSWVEYGAIAGGPIRNLASGAQYRVGMPSGANPYPTPAMSTEALANAPNAVNRGQLTFSNNSTTTGGGGVTPDYGNFGPTSDGISDVVTQFIELKSVAEEKPDTRIDVASLDNGVYVIGSGGSSVSLGRDAGSRTDPPAKIGENKSVILLVSDGATLYIDENIELQDEYSSEGALSQVVISPATQDAKFTINVTPNVSRVDSWIINPSGVLNTCYIDSPDISEQVPRGFDWPCYNTLTINGPVSIKTPLLRRAGSQDQNDTTPFKLHQSQAGENFNLRPDAYIWAENYVSDFGRKFVTTNVLDLPPRF